MSGRYSILFVRACLLGLWVLAVPIPSHAQSAADIQKAVDAAYEKFRTLKDGKNADYIPALAKVDPDLFGIAVVTTDGKVYTAGDVKTEVSIQSISKVFTMAQVIQEQGPQSVENGSASMRPAHGSTRSSRLKASGPSAGTGAPEMNPLVNPGAISATSMVTGASSDAVWQKIIGFHNDAAGRPLSVSAGRLQVRVRHQPAQPGDRRADAGVRLHQDRLAAGGRPLHAPVFDRRQREGPGDDGGDAGGWRQESGDRQAGLGRGERAPASSP